MTQNSSFLSRCAKGLRLLLSPCCVIPVATILLLSPSVFAQSSANETFKDAMLLVEKGEWEAAKSALQVQLTRNPHFHRARIELALVYMQLDDFEQAQNEFDFIIRQSDIPPNVRTNIQHMREQLLKLAPRNSEAANPHSFESTMSFSIGFDDNVRFSSNDYFLDEDPYRDGSFIEFDDDELIYISPEGLAFDIQGNRVEDFDGMYDFGDRKSDDTVFEGTFDASHRYHFGTKSSFAWRTDIRVQATKNDRFSQYDKIQLRGKTGISWQDSDTRLNELNFYHRILTRDGELQVTATTVEALTSFYTESGQFSFGYDYMKRRYEDGSFFNGEFESFFYGFETNIHSLTSKWSKLFADGKVFWVAKVRLLDSDSSDGLNYKGIEGTLSTTIKLTSHINLSISVTQFTQDYSEISDQDPEDKTTQFKSRVTYELSDSLDAFLSFKRGLRSSDIYGGINSQKTAVQLGVEYQF